MSKSVVVTTRLDADTLAVIDKVAASQGRSRAWFVAEAVRRAAQHEADFMAFVQNGIDSADRGELTAQAKVFEDLRRRRQYRDAA